VAAHGLAGLPAVDLADAGVEEAQEVVDLGGGADGGARVATAGALLDGDRGGEALDEVGVGFGELGEELAGGGAEALDVAALALGEDRVEGEAALARAGGAGDDDELAAREVEVDALQVVGAGAADADARWGRGGEDGGDRCVDRCVERCVERRERDGLERVGLEGDRLAGGGGLRPRRRRACRGRRWSALGMGR
jgi:hypothetical protein